TAILEYETRRLSDAHAYRVGPRVSTDTNGQQTCQQLAAPAQVRYGGGPLPGTRPAISPHAFDATVKRLEKTLEENKMGLVAQASASRGSAARGVKIPGK